MQAERTGHGDGRAGGGQSPGIFIDPEHGGIVAVMVRADDPFGGGIESEVARCFAAARDVFDGRKASGRRLDGENRETVVTPVRAVEKPAVESEKGNRKKGSGFTYYPNGKM